MIEYIILSLIIIYLTIASIGDIKKREVKDTYVLGPGGSQIRINQLSIQGGKIYVATEIGLFSADESNSFLADFNSWSKTTGFPNFNNEVKDIAGTFNTLIMNVRQSANVDSVYVFKNF